MICGSVSGPWKATLHSEQWIHRKRQGRAVWTARKAESKNLKGPWGIPSLTPLFSQGGTETRAWKWLGQDRRCSFYFKVTLIKCTLSASHCADKHSIIMISWMLTNLKAETCVYLLYSTHIECLLPARHQAELFTKINTIASHDPVNI